MILKEVNNPDEFYLLSEKINGVFGSRRWLEIYGTQLKLIGIYKDERQLIGGFFYLMVKRFGLNFVKLPPYTPHCGLFFVSESKNKSSLNSFSKEVVAEVCNFFTALKPAVAVLAFPSQVVDLQPFIWAKYKVIPNYTYRIYLDEPLEKIVSNFDSKNRNIINKAQKEGVIVAHSNALGTALSDFFVGTLKQADANVYVRELNGVFTSFMNQNNSFCMEATLNDKVLGRVFCVYDTKVCYYLLGGVDKNAGIQGVNNLLVQRSIEFAKELGCKVFDFEGSMLKGVEKFFRSFGGELSPYYTVNKAKLPLEMVLKFKKRELF